MSGNLIGKLAFVTGAGSGIGRATCRILAREGATVIAADKNLASTEETVSIISKDSGGHFSVPIEVDKSESVKQALDLVIEKYQKPPTIVVNCAGITRDNFLLKLSEADFDNVINVNLKGTFLVLQTFANALVSSKINGASMVNIASIVGKYGNIGQANYCASKAGVELVTKTAAKEFSKFGIRCNAVLPGFIETPMTNIIPDKVKEKFLPLIATGRFGKPEEVAEVVAFLASDKSSYINGASIEVTGGF